VITTGEGGMIVTNDADLDSRVRFLRDHSMDPQRRYYHPELGYNYRMTNVQAAIGCAQMKRITGLIAAKRKLARMYSERLRDIEGVVLPPEKPWAKNIFWLFTILVERAFGLSSEDLAHTLASDGIDTRRVFIPMHMLPMYSTRRRFPISERIARCGISLPSSPNLQEEDVEYICEKIRRARSER
jgi:perosamine synthetase